jgi:hypothetical protein
MPSVPDASSVTTFRRVNATVPTAPTKKSSSFDAPLKQGYLSSVLRATQEGQSIVRSQSVLAIPSWVSPQFKGRFFLR